MFNKFDDYSKRYQAWCEHKYQNDKVRLTKQLEVAKKNAEIRKLQSKVSKYNNKHRPKYNPDNGFSLFNNNQSIFDNNEQESMFKNNRMFG